MLRGKPQIFLVSESGTKPKSGDRLSFQPLMRQWFASAGPADVSASVSGRVCGFATRGQFCTTPLKLECHSVFLLRTSSFRADFEPSLKGLRAFTRHFACQDVFHTDILVQIRPVNSFTFTDEPVVGALLRRTVQQSGIPSQRDRNRAAIGQIDNQGVLSQSDSRRSAGCAINHQSIHASSLRVPPDALKSTCKCPSVHPLG
jgi:hypothetical protein